VNFTEITANGNSMLSEVDLAVVLQLFAEITVLMLNLKKDF
jgi:hypothetical protein